MDPLEAGMDVLVRAKVSAYNNVHANVEIERVFLDPIVVQVPVIMIVADADYETLGRQIAQGIIERERLNHALDEATLRVAQLTREAQAKNRTTVSSEQRQKIREALDTIEEELHIERDHQYDY